MEEHLLVSPPESKQLKSRKIILGPGEEVGEHVTENKEEVIIVLKGVATLVKEDKNITLSEGCSHYICEGMKHNVKNETNENIEYIYVASSLSNSN